MSFLMLISLVKLCSSIRMLIFPLFIYRCMNSGFDQFLLKGCKFSLKPTIAKLVVSNVVSWCFLIVNNQSIPNKQKADLKLSNAHNSFRKPPSWSSLPTPFVYTSKKLEKQIATNKLPAIRTHHKTFPTYSVILSKNIPSNKFF